MKKANGINLLLFIGLLLYNFVFWGEKLGINALIFSSFIVGSLFYLHPESRTSKAVRLTGLGTITTAILIVVVNSTLVKTVHFLSLITFAGFVQQRELRFVFYAFLLTVANFFRTPVNLLRQITENSKASNSKSKNWTYGWSLFVLPAVVLSVFYGIYYQANPRFADLSDSFWSYFSTLFQWDLPIERILFLVLGFFLVGGLVTVSSIQYFRKNQAEKEYDLKRIRSKKAGTKSTHSPIGLKSEYKIGLLMFISLNTLLLVVNITDIIYVWFSPAPEGALALKLYVHEGTYLLILAILLAMGIILVLFRKNLNFIPNNEKLRNLAYLWLAQNAVLAFSVGIRNYKYIEDCGLAYKRIGVFIFLVLTFFGLKTMYEKISEKKTLHYIFHKNAWALYFILIASSCINWDIFITKYNISADVKNGIDAAFIINDVSDKNITLLLENQDLILKDETINKSYYEEMIDIKKARFLRKQKRYSWLSWNLPDWKNRKVGEVE